MTYTTQQLQAMEDAEINEAVAKKLGMVINSYCGDAVMCGYEGLRSNFADRDYCNNASGIMPLAFERRIAIFPYCDKWISVNGHSWIDFNGPHEELAPIDTDGEYFMSESPLRAIACLILMMED